MKLKRTGMTLVEILVVLGIIALMVGLLLPAMTAVKNTAKKAKQQAQLHSIDIGLMTFKNDYGDYPPSENNIGDFCGAQKLAEALLGRDLLGFHPKTDWQAISTVYDDPDLSSRKDPYLERENMNAFHLSELFNNDELSKSGLSDRFVICDVFDMKIPQPNGQAVKAGTPILYYKANTSSNTMDSNDGDFDNLIYNANDNLSLLKLRSLPSDLTPNGGQDKEIGRPHELADNDGQFEDIPPNYPYYRPTGMYFYSPDYKIIDKKITSASGIVRPYRPDSYLLISAGADGHYGTYDDICNFGN
ncbi:MAG: hypothetical protein JXA96_12215 [Sedimentisphaerales bacterium]|nr:hypothetical protein [Sedimentisphaerales bacterium]